MNSIDEKLLSENGFNSIKPMVYKDTDKFSHIKKFYHSKKKALNDYMSPTQIAYNKTK
jgi:hypothetical protein